MNTTKKILKKLAGKKLAGSPSEIDGVYQITFGDQRINLIASTGLGWDHVSVSLRFRCPTWDEMSYVKDLFWKGEEPVIQVHPAKTEHVNIHPFCLHLWKPNEEGASILLPPSILVGPISTKDLSAQNKVLIPNG